MTLQLEKFGLPAGADLAELKRRVEGGRMLQPGVATYSGHDAYGLGFRFFVADRYNKNRSEQTKTPQNPSGIEMFDQVDMIETFVDRKTRLHEMVNEKIKARFPEEWRRYKEGREAPGMSLDKWGVIPSNDVMTFVKDGIFTVEQLAVQSGDKVQHRYPRQFFEYFTRAQQYVARREGVAEVSEMADKMVELQRAYAAMEAKLMSLQDERDALADARKPKKKAPTRKAPAKILNADGEPA